MKMKTAFPGTKIFLLLLMPFIAAANIFAQDSVRMIPLWKNGAPGFEKLKNEPELAKDWWVRNINNPSISVYLPPKEIATGAAVVVCPGGGFLNIVYNSEGRDAAKFLNSMGVAAFVLKYRLFRMENSPYKQEHPMQDIFRAMRLVKSRAHEFNIDTAKLGVMGFSAGGEVAGWVSYRFKENHAASHDYIDQISARPSFQILIYPGPLAVPDSVSSDAPPTFMLAANGDDCCSGYRTEYLTLKNWPQRLADWMKDNGWVKK
jgi:acetyl esterase/lipase